jgi:exodeoxyribonuclease V alpha subunit
MPDLGMPGPDSDFYFVEAADPEVAVSRIIELVKKESRNDSASILFATSRYSAR